MARTKTTGQLIDRIRNLGELRSTYVSNAVLVDEIDQSRLELFGKLVEVGACDYFETEQMINVVADTASYNVESNYFSTLSVAVLLDNGDYHNLQRYNMQDRNLLSDHDVTPSREDYRYRIHADTIRLMPTPDYSETNGIQHIYVSVPSPLNNAITNETIDGFWGWEDYIVYDCLVKFIGGKEEGDASVWQQLLAKTDARINALRHRRDSASPDTIANVDYEYRHNRRWGKSV